MIVVVFAAVTLLGLGVLAAICELLPTSLDREYPAVRAHHDQCDALKRAGRGR